MVVTAEQRPEVGGFPQTIEKGPRIPSHQVIFEVPRISIGERLQVRERVRGVSLPLFFIKDNERNARILKMRPIPGTPIKVSPEGDIHYPVWRERSHVLKPELYASCSKLPWGWSLERLLASKRRPISEVVFHQVKKDGGAVEAGIRSMDHVLERYQKKGEELGQIKSVRRQIDGIINALQETQGVSREDFDEIFGHLYQQTLGLMEKSGMTRARSSLKRDIDRLLEEAATGKDRTGRRNPVAMMKKLEAVAKRVEYRSNEAGFITGKFEAMRAGLTAQRQKDRGILGKTRRELTSLVRHVAFKYPEKVTTKMQRGIILGMIGTINFRLGLTMVKCYRPVAVETARRLEEAREMVRRKDYQGAKAVFDLSLIHLEGVLA